MCRNPQRGFSLVSAIFILVVLAALAAALLTVSSFQHAATGLDVQGLRAYQAARAGTAWGVYRVLDPDAAASPALVNCWAGAASVTPGASLAPFAVTATCTEVTTTELNRNIRVYTILAVATFGVAGQPNYVSREVSVTVSRCKDPANAPTFQC